MPLLRLESLRLSAYRAVTEAAVANLLPVVPAAVTAVDVSCRYRTTRRGDGVGGDWLAVIPLPGGRTAFTVGDVMGHGVRAAVVVAMLRSAIQALAPLHLDPAEVLRRLDDLAVRRRSYRSRPWVSRMVTPWRRRAVRTV